MRYLVIGAGGTGGLIGAYLARGGKDVALVARGEHLLAMKEKGLTVKTYGRDPFTITDIDARAEEELGDQKFDVVFVTVKAYSLNSTLALIKNGSHPKTLIIPILNSLGAGSYLRERLPALQIYDGCIYITGYLSAPGEVSQNNTIFRIVYGLNKETSKNETERSVMEEELRQCDIKVKYSSTITSEIFRKLCFTSAFAAVAAYYDKQASDLQVPGMYRDLFICLLEELYQISTAAGFNLSKNEVSESSVKILDSLSPDFTASIQKDLNQGKLDEREQLLFDIVRLAVRNKVEIPEYLRIAKHFGYSAS